MAPVRVWVTLLLIRRLREFLAPHISLNSNFDINVDCESKWHGFWCRTVAKVRAFGSNLVSKSCHERFSFGLNVCGVIYDDGQFFVVVRAV